jgi:hypothetical protein
MSFLIVPLASPNLKLPNSVGKSERPTNSNGYKRITSGLPIIRSEGRAPYNFLTKA